MLNSDDIATVLVANGFEPKSDPQRTKAQAYKHARMRHPVYVKVDGRGGALKPSTSSPLVVNHDDASRLAAVGALPVGVGLNEAPYKSTGLAAFRRPSQGDTPSGRDLSLADESALRALLPLLLDTPDLAADAAGDPPAGPELPGVDPYEEMDRLTPADFLRALAANVGHITPAQRAMLIGHAQAPGHRMSMEEIALQGGYENSRVANIEYGRLGRLLAYDFGIEELANQTQALAIGHDERDSRDHFVWEMRPGLLAALRDLGWVNVDESSATASKVAADELDDDGVERSPTTRQALVNARVGQGLYREQMLDLWSQRCAVTGCGLRGALVASHARAWKDCDDNARLDPFNGLPLTASIDRLFDRGLISFADDGQLLRKPGLNDADLAHLGLRSGARLQADCLHPDHLPYLAAHRARHGF